MIEILDRTTRNVTQSSSVIGFSTTGGEYWKVWDRYLTVNGKPAYHLGNICDTCSFLFERIEGAESGFSVGDLTSLLADGLTTLDHDVVDKLAQLLPSAKYAIALLKFRPERVRLGGPNDYFANEQVENEGEVYNFWELPHYPRVAYCRTTDGFTLPAHLRSTPGAGFNFLIPMFPETFLNPHQVATYQHAIQDGAAPTAVAISVLDVKGPACTGTDHWCMAHYILDGHHKIAAAVRDQQDITLLAFIAIEHGVSSEEQIEIFLNAMTQLP